MSFILNLSARQPGVQSFFPLTSAGFNMFRFLHTSDIHLDSPLRGLEKYPDAPLGEIRQATRRAFDNVIDLALAEQVAFILLAGDLYDGDWKDYNSGLFFLDRMARLRKAGIKVFMVSGNHDAASHIANHLQLPDNVHRFGSGKPATLFLDDLNVAIHGQGYKSRVVAENLAGGFPMRRDGSFNVGLLHTSLNGRAGHEPYAPCSLSDLTAKGYDYWALGHVHSFEVVSREPWIVFAGNTQGRHIRESGVKSACLVTVADGEVREVSPRPVDVLRWSPCTVDITGCETLEAVELRVRQALIAEQENADGRTAVVRLALVGESQLHELLHTDFEALRRSFREIAAGLGEIWLEKTRLETRAEKSPEGLAEENTPFAGIVKAVSGMDLSPEFISNLSPDIAALRSKLPPELLLDADLYFSGSAESSGKLAEDVRELIISAVFKRGGTA